MNKSNLLDRLRAQRQEIDYCLQEVHAARSAEDWKLLRTALNRASREVKALMDTKAALDALTGKDIQMTRCTARYAVPLPGNQRGEGSRCTLPDRHTGELHRTKNRFHENFYFSDAETFSKKG